MRRIPVSNVYILKCRPILLRWVYNRASDEKHHPVLGFQIQSLYIGTPCPLLCSGHGQCWKSICMCDVGFSGNGQRTVFYQTAFRSIFSMI